MNSALCVGINDYPGINSDLSGCINDANDWAASLRGRGFEVSVLLDAEATKAAIVDAMRAAIASVRYGETLVITYSGHGTWVPDLDDDESDRRDEALCPHDIADGELIVDDDLAHEFDRKSYGARIVFISDSCHSGTVNRLWEPLGASRDKVRYLAPGEFLDGTVLRRAQRTTMRSTSKARLRSTLAVMLAACADHEFAYDAWFGDRPNGAFTKVALQALDGLGNPTFCEWIGRIRASLPSQDYPQTPQLSGRVYMRRRHLA